MFLLFQFDPPNWQDGIMIQCGQDKDGYFLNKKFTQKDILPRYFSSLQSVISNLVELGLEWQVTQAWANKTKFKTGETDTGQIDANGEPIIVSTYVDCIELKIEAKHAIEEKFAVFTSRDYECLRITDSEALEFFDFYSKKIN